MHCKSCHAPIAAAATHCTTCGIANPKKMADSKKRMLLIAAIAAVMLIVIIPMVALLLWMQTQ